MPATQQMNSSPRQASGSSQDSQSTMPFQSQITKETISTITKALEDNNYTLLRQIASINADYKQLVESFTSKFVTNKKQAKSAVNSMQSTSTAVAESHQKVVKNQTVNPAAGAQQVSSSAQQGRRLTGAQTAAQQVIKQVMTNQRPPFQQPMSPTYSEDCSDTTSSDDDMLGFDQMNQVMQRDMLGSLQHLQPQMDNPQPQLQRLPTPVQKPIEPGRVMKQEDIGRVQTANNTNLKSLVVNKKNQQQMHVAGGNMASQQTLSGGQVAFSTQLQPRPRQKAPAQTGSGQQVQMQARLPTPQQMHQEHPQQNVNPHAQAVRPQMVQMQGQQSAPVLMRRVAASKKTGKGKKTAKQQALEAKEQSAPSQVMTNQNQNVTSQFTQSNTQPVNHNGGMGVQGYSTTTFQGRNVQGMQQNVAASQLSQPQVAGKGTLAIRVSEMTTDNVQQQVQMAMGQNVRVQMSPQRAASTQVINSTGLRQTAPRPMMTGTNVQQKVSVRLGNMQQRQMNPQAAMPQQMRSDQRTQATMYQQQMQATSEHIPENMQATVHHVRQPYVMGSTGQPMTRPRMVQQQQQQHLRHQTPMNSMQQVHTTSQHVQQQMVTEATRITSPQNVMLRQPGGQQVVMRQHLQQQQQIMVRSDGHQFVQQGKPAHIQGAQQFRGQLPQQHLHQQHTQGDLMGGHHQFVNSSTSGVQNPALVASRQLTHQAMQASQPTSLIQSQGHHHQHPQMSTVSQADASLQDSSTSTTTPPKSQQDLPAPSTPNVTPPPATKEPNIMPLSSGPDSNNMCMSSQGSNEKLVKGQEYLIQYSNGKKVIGIWDGRFFKVKNPQSQESGGDESSSVASQSSIATSAPSTQQSGMVGAAGDPEAMAGGGENTADKKLKGNLASMSTSEVNNMPKVGDPQSNGPRYSGPNLARRPLHENSPVESTTVYEGKRPTKRPPRPREEGKFAVCKNCGGYSADYDNCDSCRRPIPENAKLFKPDASPMGNPNKKMRSEAEFPPGGTGSPELHGNSSKLLLIQTGGAGQETPLMDKKLFYGKTSNASTAALVIAQAEANLAGVNQKTPGKGRGKGKATRGRGKAVKKSPQIETVTILSSDDDDEDSLPGHPAFQPGGAGVPFSTPGNEQQAAMMAASSLGHQGHHTKTGFRLRMEDESGKVVAPKKSEKLQKAQQQQQAPSLASQDLSTILVQLQSRSIRIGSYRGVPADHFKVTVQGVQFTIAWGEDCLQIHIGSNEITKVVCHLGESMPCMFLDTTPTCAQRLRQALEMVPENEPYYDPQSEDEVHKRITVIFENLGEMGIENYIRALFQVMQAGNPYFQKEGNLLEEIEYQKANDILIRSTPQAHLQLLTMGLGPGFNPDEEEDDEPVDRSRSPSPARIFNGQILKLFVYPPSPATGGITVTNEDLFCLNDGEFLNDVIIDFYLKYIYLTKLSEEMRQKTHIFSSFFYRRLTSKQAKRNDESASIQERRHSRVKTWTRHIDLFQKDFVIVPINESAHWYLAIICFPGLEKPVYHMDRSKSPAEPATPTATEPSSQAKASTHKGDLLDSITDHQATEQRTRGNMDTDENSTSASEQGVPTKRIQKQCCVMIFDSLAGPSRTSVIRTLREYLQVEWDSKRKEKSGERVFDKDSMKGANPKCPQQLNFSDCGIYVLQYVESFFESPPVDYNIPVRGLQDWFSEETALCKREELRQLIVALQKQINPSLQYDPAMDGCMVGGLEDEDELPDLIKDNLMAATAMGMNQVAVTGTQVSGNVGVSGPQVSGQLAVTAAQVNRQVGVTGAQVGGQIFVTRAQVSSGQVAVSAEQLRRLAAITGGALVSAQGIKAAALSTAQGMICTSTSTGHTSTVNTTTRVVSNEKMETDDDNDNTTAAAAMDSTKLPLPLSSRSQINTSDSISQPGTITTAPSGQVVVQSNTETQTQHGESRANNQSLNQKVSIPEESMKANSDNLVQQESQATEQKLQTHETVKSSSQSSGNTILAQALSKQSGTQEEMEQGASESQLTSVSTYSLPSGYNGSVGGGEEDKDDNEQEQTSAGKNTVELGETLCDNDNSEVRMDSQETEAQPVVSSTSNSDNDGENKTDQLESTS